MVFDHIVAEKKAFVFGLDNVLYPEKDYLLQVYYLFSEFMAYTLQMDSKEMINFMQSEFLENGNEKVFEKTASKFDIPLRYAENFKLLHQTAKLPLKLLLYKKVLALLQEIVIDRKKIFLLVDGNPAMQLNKIRQIEWNGLEQYLKVYFIAEFQTAQNSINFMMQENNLKKEEVLMIGNANSDEEHALSLDIAYLNIEKL